MSSEESETALNLVEQSLEIEPNNPMAYWYLANIRFGGFGDAEGAIDPLLTLLGFADLPEELRVEAEQLLDAAEDAT